MLYDMCRVILYNMCYVTLCYITCLMSCVMLLCVMLWYVIKHVSCYVKGDLSYYVI